MRLNGLVSASEKLATRLVTSGRSLEAVLAEVASLKMEEYLADSGRLESEVVVAKVFRECEQCMVRLNIALIGQKGAKKLTCTSVTESMNTIDSTDQQLRLGAKNHLHCRIRQGLWLFRST